MVYCLGWSGRLLPSTLSSVFPATLYGLAFAPVVQLWYRSITSIWCRAGHPWSSPCFRSVLPFLAKSGAPARSSWSSSTWTPSFPSCGASCGPTSTLVAWWPGIGCSARTVRRLGHAATWPFCHREGRPLDLDSSTWGMAWTRMALALLGDSSAATGSELASDPFLWITDHRWWFHYEVVTSWALEDHLYPVPHMAPAFCWTRLALHQEGRWPSVPS